MPGSSTGLLRAFLFIVLIDLVMMIISKLVLLYLLLSLLSNVMTSYLADRQTRNVTLCKQYTDHKVNPKGLSQCMCLCVRERDYVILSVS